MSVQANIKVFIKTVDHPDPQRLVDMWSRIVVNELLRREQAEGIQ